MCDSIELFKAKQEANLRLISPMVECIESFRWQHDLFTDVEL